MGGLRFSELWHTASICSELEAMMKYRQQYISFWQHLFNQISDLYSDLTFEEFIQNPWLNLMELSDPNQPPGMLLTLSQPQIYSSISELPELELRLDLNEISSIAGEVLKWRDYEGGNCSGYVLH